MSKEIVKRRNFLSDRWRVLQAERKLRKSNELLEKGKLSYSDHLRNALTIHEGCYEPSLYQDGLFESFLVTNRLEAEKNVRDAKAGMQRTLHAFYATDELAEVESDTYPKNVAEAIAINSFALVTKSIGLDEFVRPGDEFSENGARRSTAVFAAGVGMVNQFVTPYAVSLAEQSTPDDQIISKNLKIAGIAAAETIVTLGIGALGMASGATDVAVGAKLFYNSTVNSFVNYFQSRKEKNKSPQ